MQKFIELQNKNARELGLLIDEHELRWCFKQKISSNNLCISMIKATYITLDVKDNESILAFAVLEHLLPDMEEYAEGKPMDRKPHKHKNTYPESLNLHIRYYDSDLIGNTLVSFFQQQENLALAAEYCREPHADAELVVNPSQSTELTMIIPRNKTSLFVRSWIENNREVYNRILSSNRLQKQLAQLTEDYLGYNLVNIPLHIGNIYEIRYNEIIKDVDFTSSNNPNGVQVSISRRRGRHDALKIRIADKHHDDVYVADVLTIVKERERSVFVNLPCNPKNIDVWIYDTKDNLLYWRKNIVFIRQINIQMGVASKELHVTDAKGVIKKYTKFETEGFNVVKNDTYYDNYFRDETFISIEKKTSRDFVFFNGSTEMKEQNKREAVEWIKNLLERTRYEIYICDPYFQAKDFATFILPMKQLKVKVRILNCKEQLDQMKRALPSIYEDLNHIVNTYKKSISADVEVKTLRGNGELHDRFIITDNEGWVVGSSFNELGNRGTTINRIPTCYLHEVKNQVQLWWYGNKSAYINEFIDNSSSDSNNSSESISK